MQWILNLLFCIFGKIYNSTIMKRMLTTCFALLTLFMISCEKEGCRDDKALNYDSDAQKDGNCSYSRVIFYASDDTLFTDTQSLPIDSVSVYNGDPASGGTLVRSTKLLNRDEPTDCLNSSDRIVFIFESSDTFKAYKVYYHDSGAEYKAAPESFEPKNDADCVIVDLTPPK